MRLLVYSCNSVVALICLFAYIQTGTSLSSFTQHDLHALWHFNFMIDCTTNDSYVESILDYATYGCYCGIGGEGKPLDGVDTCCLAHDLCYGLGSYYCPFPLMVYFIHYHYTMSNCETDNPSITCKPASDYSWWFPWTRCAEAICNCDRAAALCFGQNEYHPEYRFYDKSKCHGLP
ncbi:phospholipase A2-like [Amphiura filiformis]|uniref:phospholipase A2-like n=1 Tax=Amphiura filiformis TaxID=82378 RepID=UPI003B20F32C